MEFSAQGPIWFSSAQLSSCKPLRNGSHHVHTLSVAATAKLITRMRPASEGRPYRVQITRASGLIRSDTLRGDFPTLSEEGFAQVFALTDNVLRDSEGLYDCRA
jgi:hypothetical protein